MLYSGACGGAMAVSSCLQDRTCHDSLVCTTSDYCCECLHGQAAGKYTHVYYPFLNNPIASIIYSYKAILS